MCAPVVAAPTSLSLSHSYLNSPPDVYLLRVPRPLRLFVSQWLSPTQYDSRVTCARHLDTHRVIYPAQDSHQSQDMTLPRRPRVIYCLATAVSTMV
ncbi:hypothetical protein B566_EDAN009014 [Ephemera danica]|nr:hypothetical protein B566_EDAN009014 [Ephemera danica]